MTGKVIDRETAGFLVLIVPIAIAIVILFTAWKWIVLFLGVSTLWTIWKSYQWLKWSEKINPFFNQLIRENQGCLTPMDLSLKANLSGRTARRFLDKKAEEFGAQKKVIDDGVVYYFLTAGALGTIFDDSEPELEPATQAKAISPSTKPATPSPGSFLGQLLDVGDEEEDTQESQPEDKTPPEAQSATHTSSTASQEHLPLIQSELAKRLDTNPSTIARRKSAPDFADWTRSKDPEGIAWKYVSKTQSFVPVDAD